MSPVYPSLESPEFDAAFNDFVRLIGELREVVESAGIRKGTALDVDVFEGVLTQLNALYELSRTLRAYLHSFVSTEARNDRAQARNSEFLMHTVDVERFEKRVIAWIGDADVDDLLQQSTVARDHEFFVRRCREESPYYMSEDEEDLATSLAPSARKAWAKLHGDVTSRVTVDVEMSDGSTKRFPMAAMQGLAQDPDPSVREAGYRAAIATWPSVEVPLAAALNSIKGWENELNRRRGWPDSIEPALHENNVDRTTLEAMQEACIESFPDFHRYLRAKARLFGRDRLPWWDVVAPVGAESEKWSWDEAASFVVDQFRTFSDRLATLAARAFLERWIDAEPRDGKRGGAFCMGVRGDESRVLTNFTGGFGDVSTVAHELGHAYHNVNLARRTPLQRRTPMALAETASTFCETIVTRAFASRASDEERLRIINEELVDASAIVVAIHSRFLFEKGVFEARERRELSATELCEMMTEAQRECFEGGLDLDALHPYMWCVSPHYYGYAYYNWPYTFGLLFGLGLYKRFEEDPDTFRTDYDDLLSSTGMHDAATLCARFGIDVRSVDFWRSSLDVVRERIGEFELLAGS
jgi:pepF/M3 family oligoendopeptidase